MNSCLICGKHTVLGRSHTHHRGVAGGRWKKRAPKTNRTFKANLQKVTVVFESQKVSVKLCAKCIKRIKKDIADGKKPILMLEHLVKPKSPEPKAPEATPPVATIA